MKYSFEKAALMVRSLEAYITAKEARFRQATNLIAGKGGVASQNLGGNVDKIRERMEVMRREIRASKALLEELQDDVVNFVGSTAAPKRQTEREGSSIDS